MGWNDEREIRHIAKRLRKMDRDYFRRPWWKRIFDWS